MSIEAQCSKCGRRYVLPDSKAGERVRCADCRRAFAVPDTGVLPFDALGDGHAGGTAVKIAAWVTGVLVVLGVTAAILVATIVPAVENARFEAWRAARGRTIEHLARAMIAYAAENGDALPYDPAGPARSLALLYPDYVTSPHAFVYPPLGAGATWTPASFPADTALAGAPCAYRYHPQKAARPADPHTVVLRELLPPDVSDAPYVMQADGEVRRADGD